MSSFFDTLAQTSVGHFSILHAMLNLCVGFFIGLFVGWIYKKTFTGYSFNRSFIFGLVFLTAISTLVIIAIGDSIARAFALAGALSIVRFRTPIKDTKDLTFIFYALIVGLAAGSGKLLIAICAALVIGALMVAYHRYTHPSLSGDCYLLSLKTNDSPRAREAVQNRLANNVKEIILTNASTRADAPYDQLSYTLKLANNQDIQDEVLSLRDVEGVQAVTLSPLSDVADY